MNIALDISPLSTGHSVRGSGFYVRHLQDAFLRYFPEEKYSFFNGRNETPKSYDILHVPYFDPFFLTLGSGVAKKTVITIHDLIPLVFPQHFPAGIRGSLIWFFQRAKLQHIAAIITDSESSKKDIIRLVGVPEELVYVIPLAAGTMFNEALITEHDAKALREKYHLPREFALYVGDATWNKNLPRLISAVKKKEVPFVMVGKALTEKTVNPGNIWNKDLGTIQSETEGVPFIQKLGFLSTEELALLYKVASVLVMPSLYEGFGLPVLEAMSSGCPVITTKRGSLPEVAQDACYYVDAEDEESIGKGIETVLGDRSLQKKLSLQGLEQSKKFSWKKTSQKTMNVYNSLKK